MGQAKRQTNFIQKSSGFTIIELLVVIVIIGILISMTLVSYSSLTKKASETSLQADLSNANKTLGEYKFTHKYYPTALDENYCPTAPVNDPSLCLKPSEGNILSYVPGTEGNTFGLEATNSSGIVYSVTNSSPIKLGGLPKSFVVYWGGIDVDRGRSIAQTSDGGLAVTGYSYSFGAGNEDMFIAKYTSDGTLLWNKTWGGAGADYGYSITQTSDSGLAVTGYTQNFGAGGYDMFIAKYSSDGTLLWDKTWGGINIDYGRSITQTSDGGLAVTGYTTSFGAGSNDMFIAKYTSDGTLLWDKTWGGTGADYGYSITQTSDSGLAVTGYTSSFGAGGSDIFIAKYTSDGTLLWDKTWGGAGADYGNSITQTSDGGLAVTGRTDNFGAGDGDMFIAKYSSDGALLWNKTWGGTGVDYGYSITQTSDGGLAVTGWTFSFGAGNEDMFIAKYSSAGALLWDKTWGGTSYDEGYSITQTSDGGLAVVGFTDSSFGAGSNDMFIAKYYSDGNIAGCASPMCQEPNAIETNPTATENNPNTTVIDPNATVSDPNANDTNPKATITRILPAPPVPVPSLIFSGQELYVAYPGASQTACKQWSASGGNTIKGFFVTQETESGYDFFTVSADGTEVYRVSGGKTDYFVDISSDPATALEACMTTDNSGQQGFGGEVTGVMY